MVYHGMCLQPSTQECRATSYPACTILAECTGTKFLLSFVQISFPPIQKPLEDRVHTRIRTILTLFCNTTLPISHRVPSEGSTEQVPVSQHLNSLFCFNSKGMLTALQIPAAWCNQHICTFTFTETVKSYSPTEAVNTPAYFQRFPNLLCCFYTRALLLSMSKP